MLLGLGKRRSISYNEIHKNNNDPCLKDYVSTNMVHSSLEVIREDPRIPKINLSTRKLELFPPTINQNTNKNKKVVNLSSLELSHDSIKVLSKGLGFAVALKGIQNESILCSIKEGIRGLALDDKEALRQECSLILKKFRAHKRNLIMSLMLLRLFTIMTLSRY